jgi:hypothetical protein
MSVGLMCDCPLPPMKGLRPNDHGHNESGRDGRCPEYAEDQINGGMCRFCRDAHVLLTSRATTEADTDA